MKLPPDAEIAPEKFTHYLLRPQSRADKSRYLARGGYTAENAGRLIEDIRSQILPLDTVASHSTKFGQTFVIDGSLTGPTNRSIFLRTVWLKDAVSGRVRFVTLIPKPSKSP